MATANHDIIVPGTDKNLKWWQANCPAGRRRPGTAKMICMVNWATSGPGFMWPARYDISSNRARSHWILWEEADEECLEGYPAEWTTSFTRVDYDGIGKDTVPVAWCARGDLSMKDAARCLLHEFWQRYNDDCGGCEMFEELLYDGILDGKEIDAIAWEIWPTGELPTGEFYGSLVDPAAGGLVDRCRFYISDNRLITQADRSNGTRLSLCRLKIEDCGVRRPLILAEDDKGRSWRIVPE